MVKNGSERKLSLFEVTNLVVGAIIGADIYVAASFGAMEKLIFTNVHFVMSVGLETR
jgi:hypothetical protein